MSGRREKPYLDYNTLHTSGKRVEKASKLGKSSGRSFNTLFRAIKYNRHEWY